MKYLGFFAFLLSFTIIVHSCGEDEPEPIDACANVNCNNGDCFNGECDCEEAYRGEFCDEEKTPSSIVVNKMVIQAFPGKNGSKDWDTDEDNDGPNPDITIEVTDLLKTYFKPTDLTTQLHPDANSGQVYEIPCNYSFTPNTASKDYTDEITFKLVDQDFNDNIEEMFFMSSIKTTLDDKWPTFPAVYKLSSATGQFKMDLHVTYRY